MQKSITIFTLLIFGFIVFLAACSDEYFGDPIEPQIDFEGVEYTTRVFFYDTMKELHVEAKKADITDVVVGFANVSWLENGTMPVCDIHALRVRGVSDQERMETLGHETLHCVYGLYHDKGVR